MAKTAIKFFLSFGLFLLCGYSLFYSQVAPVNAEVLSFSTTDQLDASIDYLANQSFLSPLLPDTHQEKLMPDRTIIENEEEDEDEFCHKTYSLNGSFFTILYDSQSFAHLFHNIQKSAYLNKLDFENIPTKKYILIEVFRI